MWAKTRSESLRPDLTWSKLSERTASQNTHLLRIARNAASSVQIMHSPANQAIPSEIAEFNEVLRLGRGTPITTDEICPMLNVAPERLVGTDGHLRIISHGTWAMHFQRHLCNAIQTKLRFYAVSLGLQGTTTMEEELPTAYGCLWLAPLIKLYDRHRLENPFLGRKTEVPLRDLFLDRPSLIPSAYWTSLKVRDVRGPSVLEVRLESTLTRWAEFSPPPATAYNLVGELSTLPSLNKEERLAFLKKLRRIAPYSQSICSELIKATYSTNQPVVEFLETWGMLTNYNLTAMLGSTSGAIGSGGQF